MTPPSRLLPVRAVARTLSTSGCILLLAIAVGIGWLMSSDAAVRWVFCGAALFVVVLIVGAEVHGRSVRRSRGNESICTFARALPIRTHDTWVVRAVYDEVADHARFPVRPADRLKGSIGYHSDDLDLAVAAILQRTGRSIDGLERNPMIRRVETVYDLIKLIEAQPKEGEPSATDNPDDAQRLGEDY